MSETRKTNGFEKPNHTQTPNSFFDVIMKDIDTMAELKVTLAIIRQTIGWHRKRTRFGVGKIERLTGLARNSVVTGAEAAELRGTIVRIETEGEAVWELVIEEDTPSNFEGSDFDGSTLEGTPPQTLTQTPSTVEGLKRNKEIKKDRDTPSLDFKNMTVGQARKVPTIKLYIDATEQFPASVLWETVHNTITEKALTFEQLRSAAVAWIGKGYRPENVTGILEWAVTGVYGNGFKLGQSEQKPAVNEAAVEQTRKAAEDKWNFTPAPPPAVRPAIKQLAQQKGIRK